MNPDFRDMLCALSDAGVEFLIVGAYALAAHGFPRATGDIDIWVRPTPENAAAVVKAMTAFGAPLLPDMSAGDFAAPDLVYQIGVAPRRIDLLTSIEGVRFEDAWPEREDLEIEGVRVPVISRSHLVQNKRAVGRPKDRMDIAWLEGEDDIGMGGAEPDEQ